MIFFINLFLYFHFFGAGYLTRQRDNETKNDETTRQKLTRQRDKNGRDNETKMDETTRHFKKISIGVTTEILFFFIFVLCEL